MQLAYHVRMNDNLFLETLLCNSHQGPTWAPAGTFISAFCNRSTRHLSHLPNTLSVRFLSADAVSMGYVQIFFDFEHNLISDWAAVCNYFVS